MWETKFERERERERERVYTLENLAGTWIACVTCMVGDGFPVPIIV